MKRLILISVLFAGCIKVEQPAPVVIAPPKITYSLSGTNWQKVDDKKMILRFTKDSVFSESNNTKCRYNVTNDTLLFILDTVVAKAPMTIKDSIMTWVNYPVKGYAVSFKQIK